MIKAFFALALFASTALAAEQDFEEVWERAVVTVEVTRKQFDYLQPWSRKVDQVQKMGTIVADREILTTAEQLSNRTLIRLQKGRGRWFEGRVTWVDHHANLAAITCDDDKFWDGTHKVTLAEAAPRRGIAQVVRWRNGILEFRNVDINRLSVKRGKQTFIDTLQLELDSEMQGIGWAEAIVQDDKLIALAAAKDGQTITGIPCSFIKTCFADRKNEPYQGLGYFSFVWQTAENPDTLAYLGQEGDPRGVIVIEVQTNRLTSPISIQRQDIILEIDGFTVDVQGDYKDPDYGNLLLENLATRTKRAGETVKIKVLRDRKEIMVDYVLPKANYTTEVVPLALPDQEPEYLVMGGFVFQPLTVPFLQSWGGDWIRKAPFRLAYASREQASADKPSYVVLSAVLPDAINIGYQESRYLIVDKLNGKDIRTLQDLIAAKASPQDGRHLIEYREGDSLRRMVLDANETDAATQRVLERYGIDKDRSLNAPITAKSNSNKLARD